MIIRGVIQAVRVEQRNQVFVDVLTHANSVNKNVPLFAQFGIASVPRVGTRCICLCLNGDYESLIAVAAQSMTRDAQLAEGQTQVGTNDAAIKITDSVDIESSGFTVTSNGEELIDILEGLIFSISTASNIGQVSSAASVANVRLTAFIGSGSMA